MAVILFSFLVLIGFIPAAFFLDRLFAINFAKAARVRPEGRDEFWRPRGIADLGEEVVESRRPFGKGLSWLITTPDTLAGDPQAGAFLRAYRVSAVVVLAGLAGSLAFLFVL